MMNVFHEGVFQYMGKRAVTHVVQKYSGQRPVVFVIRYIVTFFFEAFQCLVHQIHCSDGMMKTRVLCAGIYKRGYPQLPNAV